MDFRRRKKNNEYDLNDQSQAISLITDITRIIYAGAGQKKKQRSNYIKNHNVIYRFLFFLNFNFNHLLINYFQTAPNASA